MSNLNKSIEQLENDYWKDEIDFPSNLVINCHKYRKIPIKELTIEQLRPPLARVCNARLTIQN